MLNFIHLNILLDKHSNVWIDKGPLSIYFIWRCIFPLLHGILFTYLTTFYFKLYVLISKLCFWKRNCCIILTLKFLIAWMWNAPSFMITPTIFKTMGWQRNEQQVGQKEISICNLIICEPINRFGNIIYRNVNQSVLLGFMLTSHF